MVLAAISQSSLGQPWAGGRTPFGICQPLGPALAWCFLWVLNCALLSGIGRAQPAVGITDGVGYPGKAARVHSYQAGVSNVLAVQFDVVFDPSRLRLLSTPNGCTANGLCVKTRTQTNETERVVLYSLRNAFGTPGYLSTARLTFEVMPHIRTDSGPVTPSNIIAAQTSATPFTGIAPRAGVIYIQPVYRRTNGVVDFFLTSQTNINYDIEATTNFLQWITITNVTATNVFMDLVDAGATNFPHRFYRSKTVQ